MVAERILRAILFDFDGVIVDSEALHHRAYERALEAHGVRGIPFEDYADQFSNRGTGLEYCAALVPGIDLVDLKHRKESFFQQLLEEQARLLPAAAAVLHELSARVALSLATGSQRRAALHVLERFDLLDCFRVVIAREDYTREKPAPDAFLKACDALGEPPEACIAVEDSNKGLRAAVAAGIPCVVVPNAYTRGGDFALAAARLDTLAELSLERAEAVFRAGALARPA